MQQVEDNLKVVVSEGERLTKLIDDVLDLAKIEAGKLEWHMEPVVDGRRHRPRHGRHLVAVRAEGPARWSRTSTPDLPVVTGDRDRLIQVVINLISNAVKFTDAGIGHLPRRAPRRRDRRQRHRHRHGHRPGGPAEGVRALQAGGRHAHRQAQGHRPRPADLPRDRRAPRRPHLGGERAGQGQHVLVLAARAGRARSRGRRGRHAGRARGPHPPAARPGGRDHAAHGRTPAAHPRRGRRPEHPRAADAGVHRGGLPGARRRQRPRGAGRGARASGPTWSSST